MNILEAAKKAEELLAKRETDVAVREAAVATREQEAKEENERLEAIKLQIETDRTALQLLLDEYRNQKSVTDREQAVVVKEEESAAKQAKLRAYEIKLYEIDQLQTQQRESLEQRERALSEEKQTYKETIRKEFFEEVAKRLPQ